MSLSTLRKVPVPHSSSHTSLKYLSPSKHSVKVLTISMQCSANQSLIIISNQIFRQIINKNLSFNHYQVNNNQGLMNLKWTNRCLHLLTIISFKLHRCSRLFCINSQVPTSQASSTGPLCRLWLLKNLVPCRPLQSVNFQLREWPLSNSQALTIGSR